MQPTITSSKACEMTPSKHTKFEQNFEELNVSYSPQETFTTDTLNNKKNFYPHNTVNTPSNGKLSAHQIDTDKESQ